MAKRWFKHGKWPKVLTYIHSYTIVSFALLMVSGLALVNQSVHTALIPYLPSIYRFHILLGLVFAITLITPLLRLIPKGKKIRKLDWLLPSFLGAIVVVTGVMIWLVTVFPTTWRSAGFVWHGRISYILGAWILVHAFYKAWGYRPRSEGVNPSIQPERRAFLRWLGSGLAGTALLTVVDPVTVVQGLLRSPGAPASTGSGRAVSGAPQFPEYYTVTGGYPHADLTKYRLVVSGLVGKSAVLSWSDLMNLHHVAQTSDFHCVTGWSVPNLRWSGIRISQLHQLANASPKVKYVNFYSMDGVYTESMKLSEALDPSVMLASRMDGQPLRVEQGYPLRLIVPKMYGYKSIKWVDHVEFSDQPVRGYWEQRGYPTEAYIGSQF